MSEYRGLRQTLIKGPQNIFAKSKIHFSFCLGICFCVKQVFLYHLYFRQSSFSVDETFC